jgi:enterochelin esterase-like enzyme
VSAQPTTIANFSSVDESTGESLWERVRENGGPLIEDDGDSQSLRVTFVWGGTPHTKSVFLLWNGRHELLRHGGTAFWRRTMTIRRGARICYQLAAGRTCPDPLNGRIQLRGDLCLQNLFSVLELPGAPDQPWLKGNLPELRGRMEAHRLESLYFKNEREIRVYVPEQMSSSAPCRMLVLYDGPQFLDAGVPITVDNLIAAGRIPPLLVVFIGHSSTGVRWQELRCCSEIAGFTVDELIPFVRQQYAVSSDPARCIIGGYSRGGLASAWLGLKHPEVFGNVISHSGAFWWSVDRDSFDRELYSPYAEPAWLTGQFANSPKSNLRFYIDAGTYEGPEGGEGNILGYSRHLRDVLAAKGYEVCYHEFVGGHDFLSWRGTIAQALEFLLGG